MKQFLTIPITRGGVALAGSPFQARVFLSAFAGQRHEVEPDVTKTQTSKVLTFQNIAAPVQVGDVATLPKNVIAKIQNVRQYTRTLQCDLEIIPYQTVKLFIPDSVASRTITGQKLNDAKYTVEQTFQAYLEPMSAMERAAEGIKIDARTVRCFSLAVVPESAIITDGTNVWYTETASEFWPVTNDNICIMHRLSFPPPGVVI